MASVKRQSSTTGATRLELGQNELPSPQQPRSTDGDFTGGRPLDLRVGNARSQNVLYKMQLRTPLLASPLRRLSRHKRTGIPHLAHTQLDHQRTRQAI